jgi:dihydrofolate reductase
MGQLIITTNLSLDGVVQDPDGRDGFRLGGWFARYGGSDLEQWASIETKEALGAAALLLGRRSDEWFATRWLSRTGEWADRLNSMPKYVVSATLQEPLWSSATVLGGDVVTAITTLKQETEGEILVYASYQLGRTLIEHDLVDELRLVIFPVVLGSGERLFGETADAKPLQLVGVQTIGDGLAYVTSRTAGTP